MITLLEKLSSRGRVLTHVCKNIGALRKIDDKTLRLNANNVDPAHKYLGLSNLLSYGTSCYRSAARGIENRTLTRKEFEERLKDAISYYKRASKDPLHWENAWAYGKYLELKEFLKEHEATPYLNVEERK